MDKDNARVGHIEDAIIRIETYTAGMDAPGFQHNAMARDAVLRQLEIIGEAARHVSEAEREKYPRVDWPRIVGMRNRLIHEYFEVDWSIVWETVVSDFPLLKKELVP